MDKYHSKIYNSLRLILEKGKKARIPYNLNRHLADEGYIQVDDNGFPKVTKEGLRLLRELENIKHNDLTRIVGIMGIILSSILSLSAVIISLIALLKK